MRKKTVLKVFSLLIYLFGMFVIKELIVSIPPMQCYFLCSRNNKYSLGECSLIHVTIFHRKKSNYFIYVYYIYFMGFLNNSVYVSNLNGHLIYMNI